MAIIASKCVVLYLSIIASLLFQFYLLSTHNLILNNICWGHVTTIVHSEFCFYFSLFKKECCFYHPIATHTQFFFCLFPRNPRCTVLIFGHSFNIWPIDFALKNVFQFWICQSAVQLVKLFISTLLCRRKINACPSIL